MKSESFLIRHLDITTAKGRWTLFGLVLLLKLALLVAKVKFIQHDVLPGLEGFWGLWAGDTGTYIDPFEELRTEDVYDDGFRMPLYGFTYFVFRLFAGRIGALNSLVLFQTVIAALSIIYLARIAFLLTGKKSFALAAVFISCLALQVMMYDWYLLPQSLVSAFLVFFTYHSVTYFKQRQTRHLFLAVLFAFLMLYLYPVFFGVVLFLMGAAVYMDWRNQFVAAKKLTLILAAFVVLHGLWMFRNYKVFGIAHPSAATYNAFGAREDNMFKHELFQFGQSVGVDICAWQPRSELRWFQHMKVPLADGTDGYDERTAFPLGLLRNSALTADSLQDVRQKIAMIRESGDSLQTDTVEAQLNRFTAHIKAEKPFQYYVGSRLRILKLFFGYTGTDSVFFRLGNTSAAVTVLRQVVTVVYCGVFYVSLLFPLVLLLRGKTTVSEGFLFFLYMYVIFVFPVVFKVIEHRYFSTGFPLVILMALGVVSAFLKWRNYLDSPKRTFPITDFA